MKEFKFPWQHEFESDQSTDIESLLESSLHPVKPRSDYVRELKERLKRVTPRPKFVLPKKFQYVVLGIAGFVSGIVLLLTGIRVIVTLLATLGIIRQISREQHEEQMPGPSAAT